MSLSLEQLKESIHRESEWIAQLRREMSRVIVGQKYLIDRLIIGLIANGHILLEGVPGLAKTLSIRTLASAINADFSRIQFTPDLLPADIIGTLVYNPKEANFFTKKGPIFANLVLADEINRAPAKVQSALLEGMQERQVTIGDETFTLPSPFLVLATENPIDQEGTYPLPEAQVDRFMLKLKIGYPSREDELEILDSMGKTTSDTEINAVIEMEQVLKTRSLVNEIYMDEKVKNYILDLVFATREPKAYKLDIESFIQFGASPRATIALTVASKAWALLQGRAFVTPQDVKTIGADVLRHRVIASYEAEAEGIESEDLLAKIFETVPVP
ncbi:MAG: MoxR family ATPase [Opitutales bacterium]|nr:MoxR family ATPase [Opitutales bacterium]NRA26401.1 MoxR family ATPase [Opitutales bacterium]